mgnify:CR=1 FL=1
MTDDPIGPLDFVVIGAMKAGTTWIDSVLRQCTNADLPRTKETFFFDTHFDLGIAWHARHWQSSRGSSLPHGEVASTYYASPPAAKRLAVLYPDAKIVLCVRNPVDRSFSHFRHLKRKGILSSRAKFADGYKRQPEIVFWSDYRTLLQPWSESFPNVVVLPFEQIKSDAAAFIDELARHTGVSVRQAQPVPRSNEAKEPRSQGLSRAASATSEWLHHRGLSAAVELIKKSPIPRMIERHPTRAESDAEDMRACKDIVLGQLDDSIDLFRSQHPSIAAYWDLP